MEYGMGLNHTDKDTIAVLQAELATLRDEVEELKQIIVGQCRVITELRIKLASDAIKSFAKEALK